MMEGQVGWHLLMLAVAVAVLVPMALMLLPPGPVQVEPDCLLQ
jgi:hypothetical protein